MVDVERHVVPASEAGALVDAWRELVRRVGRSPFESPDWLLPWWRHYGAEGEAVLVAWRQHGGLVAVAPVIAREVRARGITFGELALWGGTNTPLRGWVDLVAAPDIGRLVAKDLVGWLSERPDWDLLQYLHAPPESAMLCAIADREHRWWHVDLSHSLDSLECVLALPDDPVAWPGPLGPKARHELRREGRRFQKELGGVFGLVNDPAAATEVVGALERLMAARWGEREAYFRRDHRFRPFLVDALCSALASGLATAFVARHDDRIAACLVVLRLGGTAVATLIGVDPDERYHRISLGKYLFASAIDDAARHGCHTFSFLTEGAYKTAFWHATPRPVRSGFFARRTVGRTIAAYAAARRVVPARLRLLTASLSALRSRA